jgi:hypothetical protein
MNSGIGGMEEHVNTWMRPTSDAGEPSGGSCGTCATLRPVLAERGLGIGDDDALLWRSASDGDAARDPLRDPLLGRRIPSMPVMTARGGRPMGGWTFGR